MYPFFLFGLNHHATDELVRSRYRELLVMYPPDTEPELFAMVQRAYQALIDERSRVRTRLFYFDQTGRCLSEQYPKWLKSRPRSRMNAEQLSSLIKQQK